eukprot:1346353-Prymnesium_polylepis.1
MEARDVWCDAVSPVVAIHLAVVPGNVMLQEGGVDQLPAVAARAAIRREDEEVARATSGTPSVRLSGELATAAFRRESCTTKGARQQHHHARISGLPVAHHKRADGEH